MKNILFIALLMVVSAVSSHAQTVQATVKSVTGNATVQLPGKLGQVPLTVGQVLPVDSVITTGPGASVMISPFPGSGVVIDENSKVSVNKLKYQTTGSSVKERSADLGLDQGSLTFAFAPGQEKVTDFKIHGGGAVAAARGCSGHSSYINGKFKVTVVGGTVVVKFPGQGPITVAAGQTAAEGAAIAAATQEDIDAAVAEVISTVNDGGVPRSTIDEIMSGLAGKYPQTFLDGLKKYLNKVSVLQVKAREDSGINPSNTTPTPTHSANQ